MIRLSETVKFIILISVLRKIVGNENKKPNIILLIADDLGWNDVGFHGSNEIPSPNIDAFAYHGAILNRHYTQPVCSPSRAALMTGKYPIRMGFQGGPIRNAYPISLPLNETILPQYFKKLGYVTRLIGKWHLGFYKKACTPNERGFDSFFGFYSGAVRYNDSFAVARLDPGIDARDNFEPAGDRFRGKYNTDVFTDEAVRLIQLHNNSQPLFLEIGFSAVHAISGSALQVRNVSENEAKFSYIKDKNRRMFAGVLTALDEAVGRIIQALDEKKMLNNSIVLFITDNGAESEVSMFQNHGSNWPLRGKKGTVSEGGVRGVAALWSPFTSRSTRLNNFMHLTDWLPTFYAAAGGGSVNGIDGVNQWDYLRGTSVREPRTRILVNIDEKSGSAALIEKGWKLSRAGKNESLRYGYFKGADWSPKYQIDEILSSTTHAVLSKYDKKPVTRDVMLEVRRRTDIKDQCALRLSKTYEEINQNQGRLPCYDTGCLFDLEHDPCEFSDLSTAHPDKFKDMNEILKAFEGQLVKQWHAVPDPKASPKHFNNYWTPWMS